MSSRCRSLLCCKVKHDQGGRHVLGRRFQKFCRGGEIVCCYGGEEFCVLLARASATDALRWAKHCRQAVADMSITGKDGPIQVTISLGVAAQRHHADAGATSRPGRPVAVCGKAAGKEPGPTVRRLRTGESISVAFRSAKVAFFRRAKGDNGTRSTCPSRIAAVSTEKLPGSTECRPSRYNRQSLPCMPKHETRYFRSSGA